MFRAGKPLQSAELNEIQSLLHRRLDSVSEALFKNGDILADTQIFVVEGDEDANIEVKDGRIFIQGSVYAVPGALLLIPFDAKVQVGLRFRTYEIDEQDDVGLLDPAIGQDNYAEGGAGRLKSEYYWGWRSADDSRQDDRDDWDFYPIYEVDHGVIILKGGDGIDSRTLDVIAEYDRDSNGNYVVKGFEPSYVLNTGSAYIFDIKEGTANIFGYKIKRAAGTRLNWTQDPDTLNSNNEPHVFIAAGDGTCKLSVNRFPIATVGEVIGTKERTVTVTRGITSGGADQLPDSSVISVSSVVQGGTTYAVTTSYLVSGDQISWAPAGAEPAPGSSYQVTYRYLAAITPIEVGSDYVKVSGLVEGSFVQIDYDYKLPRVDVFALKRDGNIVRLKGISQRINPQPPIPPPDQIELGQVYFDWMNPPTIRATAIKAIPMFEIENIRQDVGALYELVAIERLKTNVAVSDPTAKLGVFVDAFNDDDLRDQGIDQTGAIFDGFLTLSNEPVAMEPSNAVNLAQSWTLPFELDVILEQSLRSGSMLINPYQAFDVLPSVVKLSPSSDRWVEWNYSWSSPKTSIINGGIERYANGRLSPGLIERQVKTVEERMLSVKFQQIQFIRQRTLQFTVKGFLPNEVLSSATFDGINVTPA